MACQINYLHGNCLNFKKAYAHSCRLCIDACPHQAISDYRQLEEKLCTECGICMAVCPSDGYADRNMGSLHDYLMESEKISLNCPKARPVGFEIPCLGMFDRDGWMTLMLIAQKKPVTLTTGVCSECYDREACASSVEVFKKVHQDWPEHPAVQIQVRPDDGSPVETKPAAPASVSIRKAATGWRHKSLAKIGEWLPSLASEEPYLIPKSRQWLVEVLESRLETKIPFQALTVSESCTNCGVCAAICPQGALQNREEYNPQPSAEDLTKEDKIVALRLILEPQKCVQCRRCVETCPPKALTFQLKPLAHRQLTGKILIHEGQPKYCTECGKRIFDNAELCLVCSTSNPASRGFFSN